VLVFSISIQYAFGKEFNTFSNEKIEKEKNKNEVNQNDVILDIISQGKDMNTAINNGLRTAIESAFGTFISTNTKIVNDSLVKDEIISVSNGNIKNYTILKSQQIENGGFILNMRVNVSIETLTSFCESRGIKSEFKGGLFSANLKLQELYEKNELKSWENTKEIINKLLLNGFNYNIKAPENPSKVNSSMWNVFLSVSVNINENFNTALKTVFNFLKFTTLSENEALNYLNLNKNVYKIIFSISDFDFGKFYLRNEKVRDEISTLHRLAFRIALDNIKIENGIDTFTVKQNVKNNKEKELNDDFPAIIKDHTLEYKTLLHRKGNSIEYLGIWDYLGPDVYKVKNGDGSYQSNLDEIYISGYRVFDNVNYSNKLISSFEKIKFIKDQFGIDDSKAYEDLIKNNLISDDPNWNFYRKIKPSIVDQIINERNDFSTHPYVPAMSFYNLIKKTLFFDLYLNDIRSIEEIQKISKYEIIKH
jgi:hypothetical protein